MIPARQTGWVNAAYTFTGAGGTSFGADWHDELRRVRRRRHDSCRRQWSARAARCQHPRAGWRHDPARRQHAGWSFVQLRSSGVTGLTTFTYYSIPAANYVAASATNGTSTQCHVVQHDRLDEDHDRWRPRGVDGEHGLRRSRVRDRQAGQRALHRSCVPLRT